MLSNNITKKIKNGLTHVIFMFYRECTRRFVYDNNKVVVNKKHFKAI